MLLTPFGLQGLANLFDGWIASANVTIGGTTYPVSPQGISVTNNTIRKAIYLTDNDAFGAVTQASLLDAEGNTIAQRTDPQTHVQGIGLWIEFRWTVSET